jgi:hypothetical protein
MDTTIFINALTKIIDYLVKLRERADDRRTERFEKIYAPMYADMQVIHKDYLGMFEEVEAALNEAYWNSDREPTILAGLHARFRDLREEYDLKRLDVRALFKEMLGRTRDPLERRFLYTLVNYFLGHAQPGSSYARMDASISLIDRKKQGDAVLRTPSSEILKLLGREKDREKLEGAVKAMRDDLVAHMEDIVGTYAELKTSLSG